VLELDPEPVLELNGSVVSLNGSVVSLNGSRVRLSGFGVSLRSFQLFTFLRIRVCGFLINMINMIRIRVHNTGIAAHVKTE
jgi:hypothetical protein